MHRCNCSSSEGVVSSTVSSTSTDPAYFQHLITQLTKSEQLLDDRLYTLVKAKVHVEEILEHVQVARDSGTGLTSQIQSELATLIRLVNNSGVIPVIDSIEKLGRDLKDRF